MRTLLPSILAVLAVSVAGPAIANPATTDAEPDVGPSTAATPTWSLRAGGTARSPTTHSAANLLDRGLAGGYVTIGREVFKVPTGTFLGAVALTAELGFERVTADSEVFQSMTTHAQSTQFTVGARAEASLGPRWLVASTTAAIGGARVSASITPDRQDGIADGGDALVTSLAAGLAIRGQVGNRGRRQAWLGLGLEVGYQAQTSVALSAHPVEARTLATEATPLGSLDLGGWTVRTALTLGF